MTWQTWLTDGWEDVSKYATLYPLELAVLVFCLLWNQVPGLRIPGARRARVRSHSLAAQKWRAVLFVFLVALIGHWVINWNHAPIEPGLHDEFSYLLAGETFALGRITNPPHPMAYFFETFHVLMHPTYMSMYPPGQGLILALGIVLTGQATYGVWLSAALLAAATTWMLQGWMRPQWALTGGLLCAARIAWFSYWGNSYWGGCVAGIGGALLFGAAARLRHKPDRIMALVFAAGAIVLLNSRPWEGGLAVAACGLWLAVRAFRQHDWKSWVLRAALPAGALLAAGFCAMGYYNWRVIGHPLRLPFSELRDQYQVYDAFIWTPKRTDRTYNHEILRRFYADFETYVEKIDYAMIQLDKPQRMWVFYIGPALTIPLWAGIYALFHDSRLRLAWITLLVFFAGHALVRWHLLVHYSAPVMPVIYWIVLEGMRRLGAWRRGLVFSGPSLRRASLAACALMVFFRMVAPSLGVSVYAEQTFTWYTYGHYANPQRTQMEKRLKSMGGKHLILVEYSPNHVVHQEWVYNHPDLDNSPVLWARYVDDPQRLQALLGYYGDRRVWLVRPDSHPDQLIDFNDRGSL